MTSATPPARGFREFFTRSSWLGDRGRPLEWSPILQALAEGFDQGAQSLSILSARRGGKSSAAAVAAAWIALSHPGSMILWVAGAAHQVEDIFAQKFVRPLRANPRLRGLVADVARDRVHFRESGSTVICLPPAEASIAGRTLGALIADECRSIDEETIDILRPSILGTGLTLFIGSAGRPGSWWHRQFVEPQPGDFVRVFRSLEDAGNPSLLRPEVLAELERERKRAASSPWKLALWRREHQSEWSTLAGNPLIPPEAVERAAVDELVAYDPKLDETFISIDLSISRDLSSVCVLARRGDAMRILDLWSWDPRASGGMVPYDVIEARIIAFARRYHPKRVLGDRFQLVGMAQRLRAQHVRVEDMAITPGLNQSIFSALCEVVEESRLTWKRGAHARLEEEMRSLEVAETQTGFKVLDGGKLHRDESFTLALGVWAAAQSRGKPFDREPNWSLSRERRGRHTYELCGGFVFKKDPNEEKELMSEKNYHALLRALERKCPNR